MLLLNGEIRIRAGASTVKIGDNPPRVRADGLESVAFEL